MYIGKRIKEVREYLGMTQGELCKLVDMSQPSLSSLESGETKNTRKALEFAIALKVNPVWLQTGKGENYITDGSKRSSEQTTIQNKERPRVVGTARMGDNGYYVDLESGNGYIDMEFEKGSIAIHVRGSSMFPAIRDGWFVVIEPKNKLETGEYVLVCLANGKKMVKELLQEKSDCYILQSVSNNERITAMKSDVDNIQGISAVVPPSKHKPTL